MTDTANLEQTLLEAVRSLPPTQQEAVLNFAQSRHSINPHSDRTQHAQKVLLDLEQIQAHHGEPTVAVYVESLLRTIQEIRNRYPYDFYTEVVMALHDAMAVRNQWVRYTAQQYKDAHALLITFSSQAEITNETAENAILELDNLGFQTLPLQMPTQFNGTEESDDED
jgi:hypothetical protein